MTAPTVPEMKDGLLPCPFCGSDEVGPSYATSAHQPDVISSRFVECGDCAGMGPTDPDERRAIAAWNTRAMIAATQQATGEGLAEDCIVGDLMTADLEFGSSLSPYRYRTLARAVIRAFTNPNAPPAVAALATQQAVSPPEGVGETVAERAIRHLSRLVRVYGDMQDGNGNTPTEIRHAERFLESLGSLATARPHRNAADGGSSNEEVG